MNDHDDNDLMDIANRLDATMEALSMPCPTCSVWTTVMPAQGSRWIVGVEHELHCPEHPDHSPAT